MASLTAIEGLGPFYARRLRATGVHTTASLLRRGGSADGRRALAAGSGIAEALLLRWVNHADLMRVNGVGSQYAELLEAAGVDTVVELTRRRPEHLCRRMEEVNERRRLVRRVPSPQQVGRWIGHGKRLSRVVTY